MTDLVARPRDVAEARALERQGRTMDLLLFYGHQPRRDGRIGASCLSQWWPAAFIVDGGRYPTAEHFMMVGKARLFGDEAAAQRIIEAPDPKTAKEFGRAVQNYDEDAWAANRYRIVVDGSIAKFGQNGPLREYLLSTTGRVLVEASPSDRIWGIGLEAGDDRATRPSQWKGLNLLGFALMDARDQLAAAELPDPASAGQGKHREGSGDGRIDTADDGRGSWPGAMGAGENSRALGDFARAGLEVNFR
jgi:ribA/ribD-fused uncharacterized protein